MQVILAQPRGFCAGASAPEEMVQKVLKRLCTHYPCTIREMAGELEIMPFARGPSLGS
jgi:4-hydroxy-3-methylbut-2-enyl diphosphate reductase IspH